MPPSSLPAETSWVAIPAGVSDLTGPWLTAALGLAGRVVDVDASPVGTGQVADSIRLRLRWDPPGAGPASVVAKVTSSSEASRQAAAVTRTYEIEVGFYRDVAATVPVHRPGCYWAGHDPATGAYAVVLEDMAPAEAGDQLTGCTVDEAAAAIEELAALHSARWGDAALELYPWLNRPALSGGEELASFVAALAPGFLDRYGTRLGADVVELVEQLPPLVAAAPPSTLGRTVVHGDFRTDNLLFGGDRVCVVDWQTAFLGSALVDLSYFLGGSLLPEDRRAAERALVRDYLARVQGAGVDLGWTDCWLEYRRHALAGLVMAIVASMVVVRTDRGDDMFVAMASRAACHALDLDTPSLVG